MDLYIKRKEFTDKSTRGDMRINNVPFCSTLEPPVKETGKPRAIPSGEYKVVVTYSNTFKRRLPILINVPDFEGVRIHRGNKPDDTRGCILPGDWDFRKQDWVSNSTPYETQLIDLIDEATARGEEVTLSVL